MKQVVSAVLFTMLGFGLLQAQTYDLDGFLALVKKNNKDLQLARKDLDMAKAVKKEAWATALPKIMAQGDYKRNLLENFLYVDFPDGRGGFVKQKFKISRNNEYRFNAVLNQTLFSFKVGDALRAAGQYEHLTRQAFDASHQGIVTVAKKAFYQALLLKKVWEISRQAAENAKENYDHVKDKFKSGLVSELETLQAEVRWRNQVPKTINARKNYELMVATLKDFAGIPQEQPLELQGSLENYPAKPQKTKLGAVLKNRPDFKALMWEKELRKTNVSSQFANYLPSLDGSFIFAYSSQSDEWKFENENKNFILGLSLSIPIYMGGYTGAQVQKARIDLDKTAIKIEKTKQKINNDLHSIYLKIDEAEERIVSARSALTAARKAFKIAETSADNGVITQLDLKQTRLYLDQAMLNYYFAVYEYLAAYFDWQQATGNVQ